jgi:hypothetical protein
MIPNMTIRDVRSTVRSAHMPSRRDSAARAWCPVDAPAQVRWRGVGAYVSLGCCSRSPHGRTTGALPPGAALQKDQSGAGAASLRRRAHRNYRRRTHHRMGCISWVPGNKRHKRRSRCHKRRSWNRRRKVPMPCTHPPLRRDRSAWPHALGTAGTVPFSADGRATVRRAPSPSAMLMENTWRPPISPDFAATFIFLAHAAPAATVTTVACALRQCRAAGACKPVVSGRMVEVHRASPASER